MYWAFVFFWVFFGSVLFANPFAIKFKEKRLLSSEDYLHIQEQLRSVDIEPLLRALYPTSEGYASFEDFLNRSSKGIRQVLIDVDRELFPLTIVEKINNGESYCIVTCVPQNENYISLAKTIPEELKKTGFDGYFVCQIGGWPNPTGKEIQYVGVPYSFKIGMIREAYNLGFTKVLWIDSALLPLKSPEQLFKLIEANGGLLIGWNPPSHLWRYILPSTKDLLFDLTGVDVLNSFYVCTRVFGFDLNREEVWKFIVEFERMTKFGTPFLSCYPEEFVFTAILGNLGYSNWIRCNFHYILAESPDDFAFFFQRTH